MTQVFDLLDELVEEGRSITYGVVKPGDDPKEGVLFLRGGDISEGKIQTKNLRKITNEISTQYKRTLLKGGELVVSLVGNPGEVAIVPDELAGTNIARQVGLVPLRPDVNAKFIMYFLRSPLGKAELFTRTKGAVQQVINLADLKTVKVPKIDKETKEKIASSIGAYDDLIENNRRRIQLLEESARLLYQEWFVYLRFPGHEQVKITDGVPEGWVSGVVSDFFDTSSGGTPSRKIPEYYTGDIPWVKTQELNDGYIFTTSERITEDAIKKSSAKLFPAGTVLIAMYGATIGETGVLAVDAASNQACCALFPKHEELTPEFTHLFAMHSKQGLINLSQGAAQNNISQQVVRNYPFIMPPELLLKEFNEVVSNIYKQKANLEKQNASLAKARDLLLPKLMSGELTV